MLYILPSIGAKGTFRFHAPFDIKIDSSIQLTVKAIRTISELEANGEDVLRSRYIDNDLEEVNYRDDLDIDMHIVTLQSGYGLWYDVPARYIREFPKIDGVSYVRKNLVVQMPYLESDINLEYLKNNIRDMVKDQLGVENVVAEVDVSSVICLTDAEHRSTKTSRKLNVIKSVPLIQENRELKAANQALRDKIDLLEDFIIRRM